MAKNDSDAERRAEENYALALVPIAKEIAEFVRSRVPEGTDFGVLLFAPSSAPGVEGRIIALTSDRNRVAPLAAQWVLSAMHSPTTDED